MNRTRVISVLTAIVAALHVFPARKHLAAFAVDPSWTEGWKGFGAVASIALLALPWRMQLRMLGAAWRHRVAGALVSGVLIVVHFVPATDHVPRLFVELSWGDLWRGVGSVCAILWFAAPVQVQGRVIRALSGMQRMVSGASYAILGP